MSEEKNKSKKVKDGIDITVNAYYKTKNFKGGFRKWQKGVLDEALEEKEPEPEKPEEKKEKYEYGED